jgi:uncharacterized membrane protein YeaQ/YmgE (transglycosylase-associated protein family)
VGLFSWILFGLLAGVVARAITPGRQAAGCIPTLAVGIVGAMIGGLAGEAILGENVRFGWDLGPFLLAVMGAVVLLLALEALGRRR